jgi:hypothetical protein
MRSGPVLTPATSSCPHRTLGPLQVPNILRLSSWWHWELPHFLSALPPCFSLRALDCKWGCHVNVGVTGAAPPSPCHSDRASRGLHLMYGKPESWFRAEPGPGSSAQCHLCPLSTLPLAFSLIGCLLCGDCQGRSVHSPSSLSQGSMENLADPIEPLACEKPEVCGFCKLIRAWISGPRGLEPHPSAVPASPGMGLTGQCLIQVHTQHHCPQLEAFGSLP